MILRFVGFSGRPNETEYINLNTDTETYNFIHNPNMDYIRTDLVGIDRIYRECFFNNYSYSDDLKTDPADSETLPF